LPVRQTSGAGPFYLPQANEALAIDWLRAASQKAVGERLGLSWDEVHAIQDRAVKRGFSRRKAEPVARLGVDEKSFTRGHHYFTMVDDLDRSQVLFVGEHRTTETLDEFWSALTAEQIDAVQAVAMDMWDPYVNSTLNHLPDARNKIVFDKFHIAKHLSEAVDLVRRREHKQLKARGDDRLAGTRYDWLRHPGKMDPADRREFAALRDSNLKTAKAWALKEGVTNHRLKAVALVTGCKPCSGQRPAKCPRSYSGRRCTSR
jgi:transposase